MIEKVPGRWNRRLTAIPRIAGGGGLGGWRCVGAFAGQFRGRRGRRRSRWRARRGTSGGADRHPDRRGVKAGSVYRITEQGSPTQIGGRYDVAIDGRGYFQVLLPSGETAFTRAGNFALNQEGQLVTDDGYPVQPNISIPQDAVDVSISKSGQVKVTTAGPSPAGSTQQTWSDWRASPTRPAQAQSTGPSRSV